MTDTTPAPSTGDRVDAAIADAKAGLAELREKLGTAAAGVADEVSAAVDSLSARIDEIQAAWAARDQT